MPADPTITSPPYFPNVSPQRTLFVSPVWEPPGWPAEPNAFGTIAEALAKAVTMTPVEGNPVAVIIFPGTYNEDIDLKSWVFLSSASTHQNAVTINGRVDWFPTGEDFEVVQLYFLNIAGQALSQGLSVRTGSKGYGKTSFILHGCFIDKFVVLGRSAVDPKRDFVFAQGCAPGSNNFLIESCLFEWVAGRVAGMKFGGDCLFRIIGSTTPPPAAGDWQAYGKSKGICIGDNFINDPDQHAPNVPPKKVGWTLWDTASVEFVGCSLWALTVFPGATADIRTSECPSLSAPPDGNGNKGTVNRRSLRLSVPTALPPNAGNNKVTFDVPFPDNDYNVSLQLTDGSSNSDVKVINKTDTDFIIYDKSGGNTYDVTVIRD
jgi:hypothetical protein